MDGREHTAPMLACKQYPWNAQDTHSHATITTNHLACMHNATTASVVYASTIGQSTLSTRVPLLVVGGGGGQQRGRLGG